MGSWARRPTVTSALIAAVAVGFWTVASQDRLVDVGHAVAALPWPLISLTIALPLLALAHYVSAAVAVRAASARSLPLRTTTYAQLSAAAANRLVPNGLGGGGVNARFLRRSGVTPGGALSAMATLAVVGGLTDAVYAVLVTSVGPSVGLPGAGHEVGLLAAHGIRVSRHIPWPAFGLLALVIAVVLMRRGLPRPGAVARSVAQVLRHLRALARRPHDLIVMGVASLATTAALGAAFAMTVVALTPDHAVPPIGALIAMYLVSAAIGGAAPLPAFVGVTEATLVGGLTLAGLPLSTALVAVLLFRLVTFWAPLPLGLVAARRLRANGLL